MKCCLLASGNGCHHPDTHGDYQLIIIFVLSFLSPLHYINHLNKPAKLGDAIAISKSETINGPLLTHPLTDRGRC